MKVPGAVSTQPPVDAPARAVGGRFADLEGYRGLAAVAVVVYHVVQYAETGQAGLFPTRLDASYRVVHGLDAFVDLFFVLSAFLLTLPYARAALSGDPAPDARAFVLRRAARIVPLYLVAVCVVWAFRNPVLPGDLLDLVEHLTFTQVYDEKRIFFTIGPAWSLAVEVQFYVLLALLGAGLTALCRRVGPRARLGVLLVTIAAVAGAGVAWKAVAWYVLEVAPTVWPVWFGLPAKLDVFAMGMLLAVVVASGAVTVGRTGALLLRLSGLAVVAYAFATRPYDDGPHVWFHTVAALGFVLVLAGSVLGPGDRWVRALSTPVPLFLGVISYSLYLWHEPLLLLLAATGVLPAQGEESLLPVGLAVVLPVSVAVAWLSYVVIERPAGLLRVLRDGRGRPRDYYDGS